jgi:hypothetical protein
MRGSALVATTVARFRGVFCEILDFRRNAPKTPHGRNFIKNYPGPSHWTQKTRLGILYNLCANSGAKQHFR